MSNLNSIKMKISKINAMNQKKILAATVAVTLTLASCGERKNKQDAELSSQQEIEQSKNQTSDIADASFSDEMTGKVFLNYQQIRMALVNSDDDGVQIAAGNLAESFSEEREDMKTIALAMAEATDIEKQRKLFSDLTGKVEPMFKETISEGAIYKQFCPMAFEGEGGYWISNVDEIRNPYYGEKMLKCGKVVATIEK
ncbi:DUF3347 domain-containing protein [Kriegella sp. EG-1]|nr:DUF3347 domain-containing protein [Flavobacteriaceae bacterium EG-1]